MAKSWRCRIRLHRWQRLRDPDGQYRECCDCGTKLIGRYKEGGVLCPVRLERSLFVEGAAVAGESVGDLLGALVPCRGSRFRSNG
jgi:hypothetical protein